MAQIKLGDVIEISTSKGLAYCQYINKNREFGYLLQVFRKKHTQRPIDLTEVVNGDVQFLCFFPLQAAVNQNIVSIVGNVKVSKEASVFPIFRDGIANPATGEVDVWWFWDGNKEWKVGKISPEQYSMPIRGIWNDTILIQRIESGWRAEDDRGVVSKRIPNGTSSNASNEKNETIVTHFLYFPSEKAAIKAARVLKKDGFTVEHRLDAEGEQWLVLARHTIIPSDGMIRLHRAIFEDLARKGGGEYDGWEAEA